jgi:hypothetical protein
MRFGFGLPGTTFEAIRVDKPPAWERTARASSDLCPALPCPARRVSLSLSLVRQGAAPLQQQWASVSPQVRRRRRPSTLSARPTARGSPRHTALAPLIRDESSPEGACPRRCDNSLGGAAVTRVMGGCLGFSSTPGPVRSAPSPLTDRPHTYDAHDDAFRRSPPRPEKRDFCCAPTKLEPWAAMAPWPAWPAEALVQLPRRTEMPRS